MSMHSSIYDLCDLLDKLGIIDTKRFHWVWDPHVYSGHGMAYPAALYPETQVLP